VMGAYFGARFGIGSTVNRLLRHRCPS
jgi:hypothetical protein